MATNGTHAPQEQYTATSGAENTSSSQSDVSKDEVGWYFVEQYYTTLSKNPEKLHLFYGKRSQFVSGQEAEVSAVAVGRPAIQERIKQLDFQDHKVRISNVDSQSSFDNIVIQVIGETSNKSGDLKKFVQTFVLAQQPTGYFVLNDIFRYLNEEGEEDQIDNSDDSVAAPALVEDVEMPKAQPAVEEPAATLDAEVVDKKLEEVAKADPVKEEEAPATNGIAAEPEAASEIANEEVEDVPEPETAVKEVEEEIKEEEKPKDPVPSPAPIPVPAATEAKPAAPAQPTGPPKPLSWASRLAASVGTTPKPAVPVIAAQKPVQKTATSPAATKAPATPAQPEKEEKKDDKENSTPGSGWQTAGSDAKRQRPQSISAPPEKEGTMGYIRNVTEKVNSEELKSALEAHGPVIYFDINRGKNCAFVEFGTSQGYQAAVAANPHQVGGESIYVEPRRPKGLAYGGAAYQNNRGGMNQRGRGGFPNRGRGQGQATRGRPQPANA